MSSTASTGQLGDPCWFQERCLRLSEYIMDCPECRRSFFLCSACQQEVNKCPTCEHVGAFGFRADSDAVSVIHTITELAEGTASATGAAWTEGEPCSEVVLEAGASRPFQWNGSPIPRSYQWEAFQRAAKENHIINLPTGTGKTLIAVMLIDHFLGLEPTKRVLFLVNAVTLVRQQALVVRQRSTIQALSVGELTGDEVEWTVAGWSRLDHRVLVGTAETVRKALVDHGFLRRGDFSLVIFDEAHHAVRNHPFVEIVRRGFEGESIRIVGLTASYLHGRMCNPEGKRAKLEANLRCKIWAPPKEALRDFVTEQHFERVTYEPTELSEKWAVGRTEALLWPVIEDGELPSECKSSLRDLAKKAGYVFALLGRQGWYFFVSEAVCHMMQGKLEAKEKNVDNPKSKSNIQAALQHIEQLRSTLRRAMACHKASLTSDDGAEAPRFSGKVAALLKLLQELRDDFANGPSPLRCMLFCEQVSATYPLAHLISEHFMSDANERCISLPFSGVSSMPDRIRKANLRAFEQGDAEILVPTSSMEEGMDIPACNVVIRFDVFHNVKSHVQGAGRARHKDARIYYFDNDPEAAQQDAERMQEVARKVGPPALVGKQAPGGVGGSNSNPSQFIHPNTEAMLTPFNCLGILYEYAARVLSQGVRPEQLFCLREESAGVKWDGVAGIESCRVPTPKGEIRVSAKEVADHWLGAIGRHGSPSLADFQELVLGIDAEVQWSDVSWARRRFAFVVVWRLIQEGHIGEHNMPSEEALRDTSEHCESFLETSPADSSSGSVRFDPKSLTSFKHDSLSVGVDSLGGPEEPAAAQRCESTAEHAMHPQETRRSEVANSEPVDPCGAGASQAFQPALRGDKPDPAPVTAAALVSNSTSADAMSAAPLIATGLNHKGELCRLMASRLGRPVRKDDIVYSSSGAPPFVATVTLVGLAANAPSPLTGAQCTRKVDAEQSAAHRAVVALQTQDNHMLRGERTYADRSSFCTDAVVASVPSVPCAGPALATPKGDVAKTISRANYKGELNELMTLRLGRSLHKGDVVYASNQAPPFIATVTLVVDAATRSFESDGTGFSRKIDAEQSAAQSAVEALRAATLLPTCESSETGSIMPTALEHVPDPLPIDDNATILVAPVPVQKHSDGTVPVTTRSAASTAAPATASISASAASGIRAWCAPHALPEALVSKLEEEEVSDPTYLIELSDSDLDALCEGLKLGQKAFFKKLVRELRTQV